VNVDLDISSSSALRILVVEMGSAVIVLHSGPVRGKHFLRLESASQRNTPDAVIMDLCRAVERLSNTGRRVWDRAKQKEFNVGYDLRAGGRAVEVALLPKTVKRIAALGGSIGFTCYRDDDSKPAAGGNAG
jgi:hypothetical protein